MFKRGCVAGTTGAATAVVAMFIALAGMAPLAHACFIVSSQPVHVWLDRVEVAIKDRITVTTYHCTFRNPNAADVVGATCFLDLEPGAHIDDMSVLVDGKEMKAEILDEAQAKKLFSDVVKNGGAPALLEYYGNQVIQTQVPRIAAGGTVTVKFAYTTVLEQRDGVVRLQLLNTHAQAALQPLKNASVQVKITASQPVKNVYSPTHAIHLEEADDCDLLVTWCQDDYLPKHPFVLYYQVAQEEVAASVLAHRELGEDGYFMLMLSPTVGSGAGKVTEAQILPKDVVFCVDTSGSMLDGNKMEQARVALKYCVEKLRPGDRFNIVDFSTAVRVFRSGELVAATAENRQAALEYVEQLSARGGTAIAAALETSLGLLKECDRLKMVLFATDGLPTIGERDPDAILEHVARHNAHDVRIFVFGEGFNVNARLLDLIALNHRGEADYILPEEDIAQKISRFYDRIGSPILTDLALDFGDLQVDDVYPCKIADLFHGEQVIVYGRYRGQGKHKLTLHGKAGEERKQIAFTINLPEFSENDQQAFVPRLWAGKKVDHLLNESRLAGGENRSDLIEEVTYLARLHGIVTPYTSYLLAEDVVRSSSEAGGRRAIALQLQRAEAAAAPAAAPVDRANQVREAKIFAEARRQTDHGQAGAFYEQADKALQIAGRQESALDTIRYIGARTFYKSGNLWYDSRYDGSQVAEDAIMTVKFRSDAYFGLLEQEPRIAQYLALGNVVLKVGKRWYRITTD